MSQDTNDVDEPENPSLPHVPSSPNRSFVPHGVPLYHYRDAYAHQLRQPPETYNAEAEERARRPIDSHDHTEDT